MCARKILIVDDCAKFRTAVRKTLGRAYSLVEAASEAEFRGTFRPYTFDLVILDMRLDTGREGLGLLRDILSYDELQPVIMVSAYGDTDAVLDSAEAGALMFLHKQEFSPELLARMVEALLQQARIRRHLAALRSRMPAVDALTLAGPNPALRRAAELIREAANDPHSMVLLVGERGAGQELAAQAIHDQSRERSLGPLILASGYAQPSADMADTLWGEVGSNRTSRRKGLLEQANGGLLFLGDMELLAGELRRALGDTLRRRLLENKGMPIPLDIQFVAGSTPDGAAAVVESLQKPAGTERLIEIFLPPLRNRLEDIPLLAASYLREFRQSGRTSAQAFSRDALRLMESHPWLGNLFELRSVVEFAAIQAVIDANEEILEKHLPMNLRQRDEGKIETICDYQLHLARAEISLIESTIITNPPLNKTQLASLLGYTDRFTIGRRVRKVLKVHSGLAADFPRVAAIFGITG
ncbi:Transcriptional regulatory protein ZraR [Anaerolineae bacterium]|nr:Transcriptional regulatory protein ZraR [Anaerolineae bacterium]